MASRHLKIMVVGAHPLDPVERAGGTAAKHAARGDEIMLVALTSGVVTHAFGFFPPTGDDKLRDFERVKAMKKDELARAARRLGASDWRMLDFPESPMLIGMPEYVTLVNLLREFRPDVVMCPHPTEVGRHDHMDCGRITVAAVDYCRTEGFPSPLAPHTVKNLFMFYYEDFRTEQLTGTPRHSPEIVVDITDTFDTKADAMLEFGTTQKKEGEGWMEAWRHGLELIDGCTGYMNGLTFAERFVRFNPEKVKYLPVAE